MNIINTINKIFLLVSNGTNRLFKLIINTINKIFLLVSNGTDKLFKLIVNIIKKIFKLTIKRIVINNFFILLENFEFNSYLKSYLKFCFNIEIQDIINFFYNIPFLSEIYKNLPHMYFSNILSYFPHIEVSLLGFEINLGIFTFLGIFFNIFNIYKLLKIYIFSNFNSNIGFIQNNSFWPFNWPFTWGHVSSQWDDKYYGNNKLDTALNMNNNLTIRERLDEYSRKMYDYIFEVNSDQKQFLGNNNQINQAPVRERTDYFSN